MTAPSFYYATEMTALSFDCAPGMTALSFDCAPEMKARTHSVIIGDFLNNLKLNAWDSFSSLNFIGDEIFPPKSWPNSRNVEISNKKSQ